MLGIYSQISENAWRLIVNREHITSIFGAMSYQNSNMFSVNQQSHQQVFTEQLPDMWNM